MLSFTDPIEAIEKVSPSEHNVERVNSISELYPKWRQESKAPTFALTYQGTHITLMSNCGFTKELAKSIEESYHQLYQVSDKWIADKLEQACKDGYVTLAFGLRLRTPLLKQVILNTSRTPYEAAAEGRTAGNALGQSWCMLNSRAASEFLKGVRKSEHRLDIKPCAHIHDAQYYLIKDDMTTLTYLNRHLPHAVSWQDDPLIQNEHIGMSGETSIFYPNWKHEMTIPRDASVDVIQDRIAEHIQSLEG